MGALDDFLDDNDLWDEESEGYWENKLMDNLDNDVWETKDFRIIPITQMKAIHIMNTMRMIKPNIHIYMSYEKYYERFEQELKNRKGGELWLHLL